ncbi:MAG: ATP-dependent helicase [Thermoguttaceae bacterium]|jgi:DNA helicase-2/ATP-dependent DNA helicase PcrA
MTHEQSPAADDPLARLNPQQRAAVTHGDGPLLIVAGAGTGKTATLVHRVAWLIAGGVDPGRILLLTFTRRAAAEMLRRVESLLGQRNLRGGHRVWGGTFHAIAARLLRRHAKALGLSPQFTIVDRADAEDLLSVVRTDLGLAKTEQRFPKKGTCTDIHSRCVNARQKLDETLADRYPWCVQWAAELKTLFDAYEDRKEAAGVLDYDDLLLYWRALAADAKTGPAVRAQFDCILVDEYQDTNALQSEILQLLSPEGKGLTVVGDDAQSIYSFRAATVRNILDLPKLYRGTTIVTLEQNYRSTVPILEATNRVIALARERFTKNLWSDRAAGPLPALVTCEDEDDQAEYVIRRILEHRESGVDLRRQAVLFRASHHSMLLEAELANRRIPFHKYGGLKFVETAHVKDMLAFLRLAENPCDEVSARRLLMLLPGIGPGKARQLTAMLLAAGGDFSTWSHWKPPPDAAVLWPKLVKLLAELSAEDKELPGQFSRVRSFYAPLVELKYDHVQPRLRDLEQLEQIAGRYRDRRQMLTEMALDPPNSTQDLAGSPQLDDDYLVLSTIHSAKGLEWDAVYVIHAADGNIPSDMATKDAAEIEEELRLFYVALTRAKNALYVCCPLRYYHSYRPVVSDQYGMAQRTRFLPESVVGCFEQHNSGCVDPGQEDFAPPESDTTSRSVRRRTKDLWS